MLWLRISLRLRSLILTMTYTWYKVRVQYWMVRCRTFWKWRSGGLCHFGCSFFLFFLFFLFALLDTSLDLGLVQLALAWVFTTSGDRAGGGGVSQCAGSTELPPYGTDQSWDLWVHTFVYIERLFDCFLSMLHLSEFMQPRRSALRRGII